MGALEPARDRAPTGGEGPLRLAWIVDTLMTGGAERLVVTFAAEASRRPNVRLTVVALADRPGPFRAELEALGVDLIVFPGGPLVDPVRFLRLATALRRRRVECVHAHLSSSTVLGAAVSRLLGARFVVSLHNVRPSAKPMSATRRALFRRAMRTPGLRVVAVGRAVADAARAEGVVDPVVIPNAVAPSAALPGDRAEARAELGIAEDETLLLAVGKLIAQKAHPDLIEAFALAADGRPGLRLAIAGDGIEGAYGRSLAARIAERGLEGRATLLGLRRDVPRLLAAADLFVSASHFEGAPVSLLEAMAAGLPCAMTDVGDNRLILEGTGCPVVPAEEPARLAAAIAALLDDPDRRAACAAAVRRRALTAFGVEGWVDRHLDLYAEGGRRADWRTGAAA